MKDLLTGLFYLKELEAAPEGLTTNELHSRLGNAGYELPVLRTVQRDMEDFEARGIKLAHRGRRYLFKATDENRRAFFEFVREISLAKAYRAIFFGDFEVRRAWDYFAPQENLAGFFFAIIEAVRTSRVLAFDYMPQTDITRFRMQARRKWKPTDLKKIPVRMIPHNIVTSGSSFLVLGEYYEKKSFRISDFAMPQRRPYELKGILNFVVGESQIRQIAIDPVELYCNSVQVWVDGNLHDLTIEDISVPDPEKRQRKRIVNGEDEILAYAAASLGRVKILNPPLALLKRADAIGLNRELVFRLTHGKVSR